MAVQPTKPSMSSDLIRAEKLSSEDPAKAEEVYRDILSRKAGLSFCCSHHFLLGLYDWEKLRNIEMRTELMRIVEGR